MTAPAPATSTPTDWRVRALEIADAAAILPIYRAHSTAREPDEIDEPLVREMVAHAVSYGVGFVAVDAGGVVGFVLGPRHRVRRVSHVISNVLICVAERAQRRGIGRALMHSLMSAAAESAWCERIEFHVRATNARAIALYESLGFVVEGRLVKRIARGAEREDDLIMAWIVPR